MSLQGTAAVCYLSLCGNSFTEIIVMSPLNADSSRHLPPQNDPRKLTTLPEIISCLSLFQSEEADVSNSLTELLSAREPILASLDRLRSLAPHLEELHAGASLLSEKVSS